MGGLHDWCYTHKSCSAGLQWGNCSWMMENRFLADIEHHHNPFDPHLEHRNHQIQTPFDGRGSVPLYVAKSNRNSNAKSLATPSKVLITVCTHPTRTTKQWKYNNKKMGDGDHRNQREKTEWTWLVQNPHHSLTHTSVTPPPQYKGPPQM